MSNFATGKYAKAISDRSGLAFPYREMMREWNGSWVHKTEYEQKHPQLEPRYHTSDAQGLQHAKPARTETAVAKLLNINPFDSGTAGTTTINVNEPSHGRSTSDVVCFRNTNLGFNSRPTVGQLYVDRFNLNTGHTITKVDDDNYTYEANDDLTTWLNANCESGATTLYIDMDGVLTNYFQFIASYNNMTDWFDITSDVQSATIAANASFFTNLTKLPGADAIIAAAVAANGSYKILTTDTGNVTLNNQKSAWLVSNVSPQPTEVLFAPGNKSSYGNALSVLVDDNQGYIDQFTGAGGAGYKYWQSPGSMKTGGGLVSAGPVSLVA